MTESGTWLSLAKSKWHAAPLHHYIKMLALVALEGKVVMLTLFECNLRAIHTMPKVKEIQQSYC